MKQMKKLLCGLLMVCMVLTGIGIMPQTVQAKTASGNDGEIHWEIKGDTLTLSLNYSRQYKRAQNLP